VLKSNERGAAEALAVTIGNEPTGSAETAATQLPATVVAVRGQSVERRPDRLVGEEPLEIRVRGLGQEPVDVAVTMRTPGGEEELAVGFLVTEGLIQPGWVTGLSFGQPDDMSHPDNEIVVNLDRAFDSAAVPDRAFVATASCGICGKASIDDIARRCEALPAGPTVARWVLIALPEVMKGAQRVFASTGGLHAAALFTPRGELVALREDIGRHNAVDKVIGSAARAGDLPLHDRVLLVSGRVSFEITQKAAMAGVPILAAVSAPSDLAVATAARLNMTLVGFLRGDGFNVYTGEERLDLSV
jgi:FdhD protein